MKSADTWFVYMLECVNGSLYTGCTVDLAKRFDAHRKGTGKSKYTRSFRPVRVVAAWKITGTRTWIRITKRGSAGGPETPAP